MRTPTPHILVTTAVPEESEGIHRRMSSGVELTIGGRRICQGKIGDATIRLLVTGPGMVNTAQAITAAVEADRPALILMTGCAGAFERSGVGVGDVGIATEENDAHLGIEPENETMAPEPLPFDLGTFGGHAVTHRIGLDRRRAADAMTTLKDAGLDGDPRIVPGPFVTVATVTATERGADRLYERFRPCMENMEGMAAALCSGHYGIPFMEIRCASNLVGKRERASWDLPQACRRSAEAAATLIATLKEREYNE